MQLFGRTLIEGGGTLTGFSDVLFKKHFEGQDLFDVIYIFFSSGIYIYYLKKSTLLKIARQNALGEN